MTVHKYILLTLLCSMVFLFVSGKTYFTTWNLKSCSTVCIFQAIDSFPKWLGEKDRRPLIMTSDSTAIKFYFVNGPCRASGTLVKKYDISPVELSPVPIISFPANIPHKPETMPTHKKFRGDVSYDFSMQDSPDTSYPGSGFNQNYVLANIYTSISDKYPVVFHIGTLQTTVPYISNNFDVSLQFDRRQYGSDMADRYRKEYQQKILNKEREDSNLYRSVLVDFKNSQLLQSWLSNDKQIQELMKSSQILNSYATAVSNNANPNQLVQTISAKMPVNDSALIISLHQLDSIKTSLNNPSIQKGLAMENRVEADSTNDQIQQLRKAMGFIKNYNGELQKFKNLESSRDSLEKWYDSLNKSLKAGKDSLNRQLNNESEKTGLEFSDSTRDQRSMNWVLGIRQLGIGRSFINYSELSAKNISLFGFNAEYCNHYYFALAGGKTDFRYQDFLTSTALPKQYLFLGRFGIGEPEKKHLYFTIYTGSKQASYYVNNQPTTTKLTGFTLEAKIPVSKNIDIIGEIAKSTAPSYILGNSSPGKLLTFDNHNNEAYSFKMTGFFPKSDTRFQVIYNRYGIYFQSFNIFNNNATSASWQLKMEQYFLKRKLLLSASVTKNDYSNPFIVNNYKSQTLIYSFQSTLRIPKWPALTFGFLPFEQLNILQGQITENKFYTFLGSANYGYRVKKIYMFSSAVYTQYFNSSNQQGFIYYNARSWFFNQSVMLNRFTLNGNATISKSPGYSLLSMGPSAQWNVLTALTVGGGLKYNVLNGFVQNMGYNANIDCMINFLGRISISYEKGFIPGQASQFYRNNWGKATYSKSF